MTGFSVSVDVLTSTAAAIRSIAEGVAAAGPLASPADVGHHGLASAVTAFTAAADRSWGMRARATENMATSLQKAAGVYDDADGESACRVRAGGGAF